MKTLTDKKGNKFSAPKLGKSAKCSLFGDSDLSDLNLSGSCLDYSDLSYTNLKGVDLSLSSLRKANLSQSNLSNTNLSYSYLSNASLRNANLSGANLSGTLLDGADLSGADLSGATGLLTVREYIKKYKFKTNESGILVFKAFGCTIFRSPKKWKIKEDSILTETVNYDRGTDCGSGVNFANLKWVQNMYGAENTSIWICLLAWEDFGDIVVPYNTSGKARCARLKLIRKVI